jgi:hypothetical protein
MFTKVEAREVSSRARVMSVPANAAGPARSRAANAPMTMVFTDARLTRTRLAGDDEVMRGDPFRLQ